MDAERSSSTTDTPSHAPLQFSLRTLLWWMFLSSLFLASIYWFGVLGAIFCGLAMWLILGVSTFKEADFTSQFTTPGGCMTIAVFGFVALIVVMLLLPVVDSRPATRRYSCQNNLSLIAIALQNYQDVYGSLPPAYVADETGKPIHSWRVLLLPFLEQKPLYDEYRFDEPWDGPNNRQLHGYMPKLFKCLSDTSTGDSASYVVVVGAGTMFPNDGCITLSDIKDGAHNTIMVVETRNSGIHWMEPRDLHVTQMATTINPATGQGISSNHNGRTGANVARADGSTKFLKNDISPARLRAMLTIAGGEKIDYP